MGYQRFKLNLNSWFLEFLNLADNYFTAYGTRNCFYFSRCILKCIKVTFDRVLSLR